MKHSKTSKKSNKLDNIKVKLFFIQAKKETSTYKLRLCQNTKL